MNGTIMTPNHPRSTIGPSEKKGLRVLGLVLGLSVMGGQSQPEASVAVAEDAVGASTKQEDPRMWMTIGERRFAITLDDNETARAFAARFSLTLDMAELNGNEKHADLSQALPTDASRPGTIHSGDLMLYGSSTVVVFYKTFRSSYAYTPLGRVDDPVGLSQSLGQGSVQVTFSQ
ncbi:cyclophilin-like fold protein [Lysobacter capsici]|uniref:cyclophilin-like fold protein n=1 Tax=Lysobacter capsici TaxID=435897 RepID=UPI000A4B6F42|nr:cyclophilin-like fold protein [Lysobacter capsici]